MIGTRFAVAVALVLSLGAVALGVGTLMATIRDDGAETGRLVQTRITNAYTGDPVFFPIDDFYMSRGSDGRMRALYVYPGGFFGHDRGCRVVWDATTTLALAASTKGPGLFLDPCGGARFDRDGTLLAGPADRDLDQFTMSAVPDGLLVDTHMLFCGAAPESVSTPSIFATATPATPEPPRECARVTRDTP